jgi:hypothetical protein
MAGEHSRLGSAQVRWNDYLGTAAADDADALLNTRSLYEIAGLDRDRWAIVGIDFSLGSASEPLVVYGMERTADEDEQEAGERVAVTAFHLGSSVRLDQFLSEAFQRVSVRLVAGVVKDKELVVAEHAQLAGRPE